MIIPTKPEKVRLTLQWGGNSLSSSSISHDFDIKKIYEDRAYCEYELCIITGYGYQHISSSYITYVSGTTYYACFLLNDNNGTLWRAILTNNGQGNLSQIPYGASLPDPSAYDDGYLLTVVDGEWSIEPPSSSSSEIVDNASINTGVTLTIPSYEGSQNTNAYGHILLFGNGVNGYSSDFWYINGQGFQFVTGVPLSGTGFRKSALFSGTVQTGVLFTYSTSETMPPTSFKALVQWYHNPNGCSIQPGEYHPEDAPSNSQGL